MTPRPSLAHRANATRGWRPACRAAHWLPKRALASVAALALATAATLAQAAAIQLVPDTVNMFRDNRGANNVGIGQGDLFQYGADIVGGASGVQLRALASSINVADTFGNCTGLAVNRNFCSNSLRYTAARAQAPWVLEFAKAGEQPLQVAGPSLAGTEQAVPFPVNVSISGSGVRPTISWTIPDGFVPDAVRINIFDRSVLRNGTMADVVHSFAVATALGSYTLPERLNSGQTLQFGGDYVINIQMIDTRGDPAEFLRTNLNAQVLRRSSSFFSFTPLDNNAPPNVALPTVVNGVYNFAITQVGPGAVTFIDPFVAVGYDYQTGAGDPNFASVLLPTGIGDNLFDLWLWDGTQFIDSGTDLTGGSQFFFAAGGVDRFSIRGIETNAGLDPANVSAFITGLTFSDNGSFTGTMTPITVLVPDPVPEPGALSLGALALALGWRMRRRPAA